MSGNEVRRQRRPGRPASTAGFSLVELIVVLAIVGVLSAIVYPSYRAYGLESRRTAAQTALQDAASRQEQIFLNNKTYTTTVGAGGLNVSATTEGGSYTLAVTAATLTCPIAQCFVMTATPQGNQATDDCGTLSIESDGDKLPAGCW